MNFCLPWPMHLEAKQITMLVAFAYLWDFALQFSSSKAASFSWSNCWDEVPMHCTASMSIYRIYGMKHFIMTKHQNLACVQNRNYNKSKKSDWAKWILGGWRLWKAIVNQPDFSAANLELVSLLQFSDVSSIKFYFCGISKPSRFLDFGFAIQMVNTIMIYLFIIWSILEKIWTTGTIHKLWAVQEMTLNKPSINSLKLSCCCFFVYVQMS